MGSVVWARTSSVLIAGLKGAEDTVETSVLKGTTGTHRAKA